MIGDNEPFEAFLTRLGESEAFVAQPPAGKPATPADAPLPADVQLFYEHFGGGRLFPGRGYGIDIVAPGKFRRSDGEFPGRETADGRSRYWYTVAGTAEQKIVIDLAPLRAGRCYDGFWETYGMHGHMPVIALSFSEFLRRYWLSDGRCYYWLHQDRLAYGDAFD